MLRNHQFKTHFRQSYWNVLCMDMAVNLNYKSPQKVLKISLIIFWGYSEFGANYSYLHPLPPPKKGSPRSRRKFGYIMCTDSSYSVMGRDNLRLSQGYAQLHRDGISLHAKVWGRLNNSQVSTAPKNYVCLTYEGINLISCLKPWDIPLSAIKI